MWNTLAASAQNLLTCKDGLGIHLQPNCAALQLTRGVLPRSATHATAAALDLQI
jgi:hypothetical protein